MLNLLLFTTYDCQRLEKEAVWSPTPAQIYVLVRGTLLHATRPSSLSTKLCMMLSVHKYFLLVGTSLANGES